MDKVIVSLAAALDELTEASGAAATLGLDWGMRRELLGAGMKLAMIKRELAKQAAAKAVVS
jgi:hypothetical protein